MQSPRLKQNNYQRLRAAESRALQCSDSTVSCNLFHLQSAARCAHHVLCQGWNDALARGASPRCSARCGLTRTNAFDRKRGLGQEVWVGEHVLFVDHEAQEREFWLVHGQRHGICSFPRRVEAVVTCGGAEGQDNPRSLAPSSGPQSGFRRPVSTAALEPPPPSPRPLPPVSYDTQWS